MSEEAEVIRRFAILAYDPSPSPPRRGRNHLMGTIYTKEELEKRLDQFSLGHRKHLMTRVVELTPVTTAERKVTEIKEVIV